MIKLLYAMLLMMVCSGNVLAAEENFTQATFDRLQKQGASILVSIHADWCPTCLAQVPVIKKLLEQDEFKPINALQVDFDQQKDVVNAFKAIKQSTLIVFKDGKEVDRSIGVTDEQDVAALLRKAL